MALAGSGAGEVECGLDGPDAADAIDAALFDGGSAGARSVARRTTAKPPVPSKSSATSYFVWRASARARGRSPRASGRGRYRPPTRAGPRRRRQRAHRRARSACWWPLRARQRRLSGAPRRRPAEDVAVPSGTHGLPESLKDPLAPRLASARVFRFRRLHEGRESAGSVDGGPRKPTASCVLLGRTRDEARERCRRIIVFDHTHAGLKALQHIWCCAAHTNEQKLRLARFPGVSRSIGSCQELLLVALDGRFARGIRVHPRRSAPHQMRVCGSPPRDGMMATKFLSPGVLHAPRVLHPCVAEADMILVGTSLVGKLWRRELASRRYVAKIKQ